MNRTTSIETADGVRLHFSDWGAGKPVVLIHGWGMGSAMWEYQIPFLRANGIRCITYDQRGCGRSDHPTVGYDMDTLADDLASLLDHLDLHDITLVGFSLGGGVIARYLTRHGSSRIAGCVLVSTTTPWPLKTESNPEGMDPALVFDGFIAGLQTDRPALLAACAPAFFGVTPGAIAVSPEMMKWAADLCFSSSALGMFDLYMAVNRTDQRPDMKSITVPTLIVHGEADAFSPPAYTALRTAKAIPGSRLELYPDASHGLFITHRERLNGDLLRFVNSLSAKTYDDSAACIMARA